MSDRTKLPPGSKTSIVLRRKRKSAPAPSEAQQQGKRGIVPVDDETGRYLRRAGSGTITFFDLGTRLRSVPAATTFNALRVRLRGATDVPDPDDALGYYNEYVETQLSEPVTGAALTDAGWLALTRELLGSRAPAVEGETPDPLDPCGHSPANGSGRAVAHCKQILPGWFTVGGKSLDSTDELVLRQRPEADNAERWSKACVWDGTKTPPEARYKLKKRRVGHIAGGAGGGTDPYRRFDTSDTANYKITRAADYTAAAVPFRTGAAAARVYLVPYLYRYTVYAGAEVVARCAGRIYTIYPTVIERQPGDVAEPRMSAHAERTPASGYAAGRYLFKDGLTPPVRAGSLAAVIVLDGRAPDYFYVWSQWDEAAYSEFAYPNETDLADMAAHAVNVDDTANPLDHENQSNLWAE